MSVDNTASMPDAQASSDDLEMHFRFLDLPAEIRNRIYDHALGGRSIHVRKPEIIEWPYLPRPHEHLKLSMCMATSPSNDIPEPGDEYRPACRVHHKSFEKEHYDCLTTTSWCRKTPLRPNLALNLLRTCRQVHTEAALIPFTTNHFIVTSFYGSLAAFADLLTKRQLAAVKEMTIHLFVPTYVEDYEDALTENLRVEPFSGLEDLTLRIEEGCNGTPQRIFNVLQRVGDGGARFANVNIDVALTGKMIAYDGDDLQEKALRLKQALLKTNKESDEEIDGE